MGVFVVIVIVIVLFVVFVFVFVIRAFGAWMLRIDEVIAVQKEILKEIQSRK